MIKRNMKIKEAKTESAEYIVQYFLIRRLYVTRSITVSIGILFRYKITTSAIVKILVQECFLVNRKNESFT